MKDEAISLRRISDRKQADGHSLVAQANSTERMAKQLSVPIAKTWNMIQTSKKGKNFGRRDMEEMLRYCKQNPQVKYLLIDFVNRLMREVEVMIYYKVRFNQIGVRLYFCDPAQHHLNSNDQYSQLMLYIEGYKAEQDNASRGETTIARMKARYAAGYYPSKCHAGYMKTALEDGLHVPDEPRFSLLQKGCRLIIYEQYTVSQAVRWMNDNGYRTIGGNKLDINHFEEFIVDRYYCGKIDVRTEGWPKDVDGLHTPMLSLRENELLVSTLSKRNPRIRYQHNPEFPMANLLRHYECKGIGKYEKFAGHNFNRGKRPSGTPRKLQPVYDCRDCRRRIHREKVHTSISDHLESLMLLPDEQSFRKAVVKVWKRQRGSVAQRITALQTNKSLLEQKIRDTAAVYASEAEGAAKAALKLLLQDYDTQLKQLDTDIRSTKDVEMESEDFVRFAIDFTANIRDKWWDLSWENHKRGEQILFNGEIYADNSAKVHTPKLSSIYRLGTNKKALSNVDNAHLVELVGTTPTSAGLSWLVFYRHSSLSCLRQLAQSEPKTKLQHL